MKWVLIVGGLAVAYFVFLAPTAAAGSTTSGAPPSDGGGFGPGDQAAGASTAPNMGNPGANGSIPTAAPPQYGDPPVTLPPRFAPPPPPQGPTPGNGGGINVPTAAPPAPPMSFTQPGAAITAAKTNGPGFTAAQIAAHPEARSGRGAF